MDYDFTSSAEQRQPSRVVIEPQRLLEFGALFGLGLIVLGIIWAGVLRGDDWLRLWFPVDDPDFLLAIGGGLVLGGGFSLAFWYIGRLLPGFEQIRQQLARSINLEAMKPWHMVGISLVAAVPEEIFFRGAMQPSLGLVLTAIIFGVLHAMTPLYGVYAFSAGFILGLLAEWQGNLWMPMTVHFGIDFVSLWLMARWAKSRHSSRGADIDIHEHPTISDSGEI
jgi:membrane protease YdiL (CAAX protease family)